MKFDRGKREFLCNLRIFDFSSLIKRKTLHTLGHIRTRGNCAATAKCFEFNIRDDALVVNTNLQLHNVSTAVRTATFSQLNLQEQEERGYIRRCTYKPGSNVHVVFWERADLRPDYQINSKKDMKTETMVTTYIPGLLIMRNNLLMICPGDYRASGETRNAGEG